MSISTNTENHQPQGQQLRPYQIKALSEIRHRYTNGDKKVLLHMATGSGKTTIFGEVLKGVYKNGKKAVMVVKGTSLVDQASQRLARENVPHGVFMGNHWRYRPEENIQICSVDTVARRKIFPEADLVVIDECHLATSKSFINFLSHYDDKFFLAVSATPFSEKSLAHLASVVVKPITVQELTNQGYLSPLKYFAPRTPDLSNIHDVGGDFDLEQLSKEMRATLLVADIVTEWEHKAKGTPTLCFAVDVAHSKIICDAFKNRGINAVHIDAVTPLNIRKGYIDDLQIGKISVIVNCGIFTTGVDIPHLKTIIIARPTKSYNLHIQILGRGTRIFDGKNHCTILDHAGNVQRHGFIHEERECDLEPIDKKESRPSPITCKNCFGVFEYASIEEKGICPLCGEKFTPDEMKKCRELKQIDGDLVEIKELTIEEKARRDVKLWKKEAKKKGYKKGWAYFRCKERYGEELTSIIMPKRIVPDWIFRK